MSIIHINTVMLPSTGTRGNDINVTYLLNILLRLFSKGKKLTTNIKDFSCALII